MEGGRGRGRERQERNPLAVPHPPLVPVEREIQLHNRCCGRRERALVPLQVFALLLTLQRYRQVGGGANQLGQSRRASQSSAKCGEVTVSHIHLSVEFAHCTQSSGPGTQFAQLGIGPKMARGGSGGSTELLFFFFPSLRSTYGCLFFFRNTFSLEQNMHSCIAKKGNFKKAESHGEFRRREPCGVVSVQTRVVISGGCRIFVVAGRTKRG